MQITDSRRERVCCKVVNLSTDQDGRIRVVLKIGTGH